MANIIRWDPFREGRRLHNMLDRFMDQAMSDSPWFDGVGMGRLPLDVLQTDEEFTVKASVPGFRPEDIDISISGDTLTISAEVGGEREKEDEERNYLLRERHMRSFSRSITLPTSVDSGKASAEFSEGVLTLTLPKAEEVKPKRITIKAK